ncbi:MAG: hypothetical protein MUF11_01200 [Beijerinckiaceae bacterium]|jgi:hypothetical protein|nr:hypothetical protein [Beijerinckiaceae bacterium]
MARPFAGRDKFRVFNHGTFSIFAGAMCLALSGCYSATGDFGRPQQGVWENSILPTMGIVAATSRGEPASWYALTEDEKELRNRAWNFLMPETDAPVLTRMQDHFAYHRLLPPRGEDVTLFHRTIMGGPYLGGGVGYSPSLRVLTNGETFRSLTSRYNRVRDVITADHALIPHFKLIAAQVVQADHVRARSLTHVAHLTEEQREQAIKRICENALIIARVQWAYHDRAAQYRYSLEHLLVEGPEREAIPAERTLMAFEADIGRFRKDTVIPTACTEPVALPEPLAPRPLVRKG